MSVRPTFDEIKAIFQLYQSPFMESYFTTTRTTKKVYKYSLLPISKNDGSIIYSELFNVNSDFSANKSDTPDEIYISVNIGAVLKSQAHISIRKDSWNNHGLFHLTLYPYDGLGSINCNNYYTIDSENNISQLINKNFGQYAYDDRTRIVTGSYPQCTPIYGTNTQYYPPQPHIQVTLLDQLGYWRDRNDNIRTNEIVIIMLQSFKAFLCKLALDKYRGLFGKHDEPATKRHIEEKIEAEGKRHSSGQSGGYHWFRYID